MNGKLLLLTGLCFFITQGAQAEEALTIKQLVQHYERQSGNKRRAAAAAVFGRLQEEAFVEKPIAAAGNIHPDSLNMLVWYWAGEYLYARQDYEASLHYASLALPLTYRGKHRGLSADCEQLIGVLHFRRSDYASAIEHIQKALELDRRSGDKLRVSSSLNVLAGICLTSKQFEEGEKYILEALRYSSAERDSNRMAIQYGMASEIYHAMNRDEQAFDYAHRAYRLDSIRGNRAKTGIRLSQMAAAQMALGRDAAAEKTLRRAIPLLREAGNRQSLGICNNQLGEALNRRQAQAEALNCFEEAAAIFAQRGDMYNESRSQKGLYEALKEIDPARAAQHLLRYAQLKDSIYLRDTEQAVSRYNVKYKTDELALQREQERTQKLGIFYAALLIVALLISFVAFLLYSIHIRRRNHRLLKQMSDMRENFFTNITHEFRTPLTIILGLSRNLQRTPVSSSQASDMGRDIERQGNSLLTLINQLLDIAKLKSAPDIPEAQRGNITAYLAMIVESYQGYAHERSVDLRFLPEADVETDFVPDYVNKVMNNLLSNAFKFTPENGSISVSVGQEKDKLQICVADTGIGIDKESLGHIFEAFYQVKPDTQGGTGVGLALVKQLVDALDGSIRVDSAEGKGTTFFLSFPIRHESSTRIADSPDECINRPLLPEDSFAVSDSRPEGKGNSPQLLIIEDNPDVARYIGNQLAGRYAITYAPNGKEGLKKAEETVPDLIVTDLMMPLMDGLELCRRVRSNEIISHIPIIVVTAKVSETDRIKGLEAGADAYLSKPFSSDELSIRVEKLLEQRKLLQQKYSQTALETAEEEKNEAPQRDIDRRFLVRVVDYIYLQLNSEQEVSVNLVATQMCMSSRQFHRKIMALTGSTPVAYIQSIKIRKAKQLLDNQPQLSLADVATQTGFGDYSNFVRAFKQACGITPSQYLSGASPRRQL